MDKLRIGIIGTGGIAHKHMDSYKKMGDIEIIGAADIVPGKARAFLDEFGLTDVPAFMTLEVRRSNEVAQNLYRSHGFVDVGYRKRYYEDNHEDALIMTTLSLPEAHPENDPFLVAE